MASSGAVSRRRWRCIRLSAAGEEAAGLGVSQIPWKVVSHSSVIRTIVLSLGERVIGPGTDAADDRHMAVVIREVDMLIPTDGGLGH